jgi:hypothetical protein
METRLKLLLASVHVKMQVTVLTCKPENHDVPTLAADQNTL